MARVSKKYARNKEKKPSAPLTLEDAVGVLKKFEGAKFDESVELAVKLGIDPKNTNQIVRGAFSLLPMVKRPRPRRKPAPMWWVPRTWRSALWTAGWSSMLPLRTRA